MPAPSSPKAFLPSPRDLAASQLTFPPSLVLDGITVVWGTGSSSPARASEPTSSDGVGAGGAAAGEREKRPWIWTDCFS